MEKRYQVFVSSTFRDLQEERQAVTQALLELDCIPSGMEMFPASDDDQWTLIKSVIDDCDYYIVIIAGMYGSTDKDGVSYTEREFDYAVEAKKPVLAFIHEDIGKLASEKTEDSAKKRKALENFTAKAKGRMAKFWTNAEGLGGAVSRSLVQEMKRRPGEGWVRARFASDPETVLSLKKKIEELTQQLSETPSTPKVENLAELGQGFNVDYKAGSSRNFESFSGKLRLWFEVIGACLVASSNANDSKIKKAVESYISHSGSEIGMVVVKSSTIDQLILQFSAMGLIEKQGGHWRLTPGGTKQLYELATIKKP